MRKISRPRSSGFTLIELMVALAIAGILAAIAYPAYTKQLQRGRRADAVSALTAVMQAQERYRGNQSNYASSLVDLNIDVSKLTKHYQVSLTGVGTPASFATGYTATATTVSGSPQAADATCKTLAITMVGATPTYSATGDPNNSDTTTLCWPQ